jgi:acetylornithine deacetylase
VDIINQNIEAVVKPRSLNLKASSIPENHGLVQAGIALGRTTYGSPTLSDQSVLDCQSLKLGPGNSLRSHTSNEFIYLSEINEGIEIYINILNTFLKK